MLTNPSQTMQDAVLTETKVHVLGVNGSTVHRDEKDKPATIRELMAHHLIARAR